MSEFLKTATQMKSTKFVVREVEDPITGESKYVLRSTRNKFDDEFREAFCLEIAKHGRIGDAARAAGVAVQTARKYMMQNADFAKQVADSIEVYKDRLLQHHQDLVFNGTVKKSYDRNGNLISEETQYPIRLIELELKKHDPGYRDRQEVSMTHKGGVVVAPGRMSMDEWKKKYSKGDDEDVVEAEFTDVSDDGPLGLPEPDDKD